MNISDLPLVSSIDLTEQGSFTTPSNTGTNYSKAMFCLSEDKQSVFVAGGSNERYVSQIAIPDGGLGEILNDNSQFGEPLDVDVLNFIQTPALITGGVVDNGTDPAYFYRLDPRIGVDRFRIIGMLHKGGKLYINHIDWYDTTTDRIWTTFVVEDASDLANSAITSNYVLEGQNRQEGQFVEIPVEYQSLFGGDVTTWTGTASIVSRFNTGPGFRSINLSDFGNAPDLDNNIDINGPSYMNYLFNGTDANGKPKMFYDKDEYTDAFIDSLANLTQFTSEDYMDNLAFDKGNGELTQNAWWSISSRVLTAFVIDGTRTMAVLTSMLGGSREPGRSGWENLPSTPTGVNRGMIYKDSVWEYNGSSVGYELSSSQVAGNAPAIEDDVWTNVFLFDLLEIDKVKNGQLNAWEVRPYHRQQIRNPTKGTNGWYLSHVPYAGQYDYSSKKVILGYHDAVTLDSFDSRPLYTIYDVSTTTETQSVGASSMSVNTWQAVNTWSAAEALNASVIESFNGFSESVSANILEPVTLSVSESFDGFSESFSVALSESVSASITESFGNFEESSFVQLPVIRLTPSKIIRVFSSKNYIRVR